MYIPSKFRLQQIPTYLILLYNFVERFNNSMRLNTQHRYVITRARDLKHLKSLKYKHLKTSL